MKKKELEKRIVELEELLQNARECQNHYQNLYCETIKEKWKLQEKYYGLFPRRVLRYKDTTLVYFLNGLSVRVKKDKNTPDSVYSAVAYAIAEKMFKNNSHFKNKVDKCLKAKPDMYDYMSDEARKKLANKVYLANERLKKARAKGLDTSELLTKWYKCQLTLDEYDRKFGYR